VNDTDFIAFAEVLVSYVDERFGRVAAWFCAAFLVVLPVLFILLMVRWLIR